MFTNTNLCYKLTKELCCNCECNQINNSRRYIFLTLKNENMTHQQLQDSPTRIFSRFAKDLSENQICEHYPEMKMRFIRLIEYPLNIRNKQVLCTTISCYTNLEKPEKLKEENINLAYLLGWFREMLQTVANMSSNAVENAHSNNIIPWECYQDIGLQIQHELCILQHSMLLLLRNYFSDHYSYKNILTLIDDTLSDFFYGKILELRCKDIEYFNIELVRRIAGFKIASIYYKLPVILALYLTESENIKELDIVKDIFQDIAMYKKIEMDFLDSFGKNAKHLNIKHGYCSWLAVKALEISNRNQKATLNKHYGQREDTSLNKMYSLYTDLNMPLEYEKYKLKNITTIQEKIGVLTDKVLQECLINMFEQTLEEIKLSL